MLLQLKQIQRGLGIGLLPFAVVINRSNFNFWLVIIVALMFVAFSVMSIYIASKEYKTTKSYYQKNKFHIIAFGLFLLVGGLVPLYFLSKV